MTPPMKSDHDLLITLNAKVDRLIVDVKAMGDGTGTKLAEHEVRIKKIEDLALQTDAPNSYKEMLAMKEEIHDFKNSLKSWKYFAGMIGAAVFFVLTRLPTVISDIVNLFK